MLAAKGAVQKRVGDGGVDRKSAMEEGQLNREGLQRSLIERYMNDFEW